jgi:hypothetical protein
MDLVFLFCQMTMFKHPSPSWVNARYNGSKVAENAFPMNPYKIFLQ